MQIPRALPLVIAAASVVITLALWAHRPLVVAHNVDVRHAESQRGAISTRQPTSAGDAEALFFDALVEDATAREAAKDSLEEWADKPGSPRSMLWLGLCHLWELAEGEGSAEAQRASASAALRWLTAAEQGLPSDDRIATWRASAAWALARLDGREADADDAIREVIALAQNDACFHAITLAVMTYDAPAESRDFCAAHDAMESAFRCGEGDPSGLDGPRWPNNVLGFLVALSDVRLKAGDESGAEAALLIAEARPGFQDWKFRAGVNERFERLTAIRSGAPHTDIPFALSGLASCLACHAR